MEKEARERLTGSPVTSCATDSSEETGDAQKPGLELLCRAAEVSGRDKEDSAASEDAEDSSRAKSKRPWTVGEDELLRSLVEKFGPNRWTLIAAKIEGRSGKQARERWLNQLNPELKRKGWTLEEDRIIIEAHMRYGNKWSMIARLLKGRTDNAIKNRFNSTLRRRLQRQTSYVNMSRRVTPVGYYALPPFEAPTSPLTPVLGPAYVAHNYALAAPSFYQPAYVPVEPCAYPAYPTRHG